MHRKIQGRMGMEYRAEVPLKLEVPQEQYVLALEGRADGIITSEEGVTIDEIKCMYTDVTRFEEPIFVHKAQAMCYAYIYALQNGLDQISVQLTYCDLDTEEICRFEEAFSFFWLERWFQDMMEAYRKWTDFQFAWRKIRQTSIQTLEFPFPYREGQYKLVGDVYRTIHRKKNIVYPGTYRNRKDDFYAVSGNPCCWGKSGRQNILSHGKDDYTNGGKGYM